MSESIQPSPSYRKIIAKWLIRFLALLLFTAACLTHFWPFVDPYVPADRSDRKQSASVQSAEEIKKIQNEVALAWEIIESKMASSERDLLEPPADDQVIADLEFMMGIPLPPAFKASLKIHNGCKSLLKAEVILDHYQSDMRVLNNSNDVIKRSEHFPSSLRFTELLQSTHRVPRRFSHANYIEIDTGAVRSFRSDFPTLMAGPRSPGIDIIKPTEELYHSDFLVYLQTVAKQSKKGDIRW